MSLPKAVKNYSDAVIKQEHFEADSLSKLYLVVLPTVGGVSKEVQA